MSDERPTAHPETGMHYRHVFPTSPVFTEISACYQAAAERLGWMSVDALEGWNPERPEWGDMSLAVIFWGKLPEVLPDRRCLLATRYTESVGQLHDLVEGQQRHLLSTVALTEKLDLLIGGSPTVSKFFGPHCKNVAHAPIGYDPVVMGTPDWEAKKSGDLVFRGTPVGRREWILPLMEKRFGLRYSRLLAFGEERKYIMDRRRVDLYIGHSEEPSFPGMRLWQSIASSTALLTEPRDAWPAKAGVDYIELPLADQQNPEPFLGAIEAALDSDLEKIARAAHRHLSKYTVDLCMHHFVIPAIEKARLVQ